MKSFHRGKLLLAISFLLACVSGSRFSDAARRRGHTRRIFHDVPIHSQYANASGSRFYNNATQEYFVASLPDIPQNFITEMYSGLIPTNMSDPSRALFYVFQPTIGPQVEEVTIWLNGGPGCSSLEGFFQENGQFQWGWGQFAPTLNPYSWVNLTNMLWVEYPVGTGFSIGQVTASLEEQIAADFLNFFQNFQNIFGIQNFKIYITGESYAGRYVPYIASAMLDENDTTYFGLSGILLYDPTIGSFITTQQQIPVVPFVLQNKNLLGFNASYLSSLELLDEVCNYTSYREKYLTFPASGLQPPTNSSVRNTQCDLWDSVYTNAYLTNPCFNVYEINQQCPLPGDILGMATDLAYSYPNTRIYPNRTDVKIAMHAPLDISWSECAETRVFVTYAHGGPESEDDLSADPIQSVLPRIIDATQRVLISNGALDLEILTNGTLLAIQNMTWGGQLGFTQQPSEPIVITLPDLQYQAIFHANGMSGYDTPQGVMGVQHFERGLMWAETYLSGHMQPQFQPRSSYLHLQWVLGRIEML